MSIDHDIAAAIIGPLIAAIIAGGVAVARFLVHMRDDLRSRVGSPNGHGNAIEMLEHLVNGQAGQDNRLAKLERDTLETRTKVDRLQVTVELHGDRLEGLATGHGERLGAVEQDVAVLQSAPCLAPDSDP